MGMLGKCNCGSVAFELKGELPAMYKCFCTLCQRQGGAASNAATIMRLENFAWLSGEDKIEKWKKSTGFNSHFCKSCGSPVPNLFRDKYVWVPVGLLDAPKSMKVVAHVFLNTKPAWEELVSVAHQFDEGPENVEELVRILENASQT